MSAKEVTAKVLKRAWANFVVMSQIMEVEKLNKVQYCINFITYVF